MIFINLTKKEYAKTIDAVSLGLMLQIALTQISPSLLQKTLNIFAKIGLKAGTVVYTNAGLVLSCFVYALIFILPAIFIKAYTPKTSCVIGNNIFFPKKPITVIIGTIGVISLTAYLSALAKIFLEALGLGIIEPQYNVPSHISSIILFAIYTSVIPAIVEEILFRKVILNRILPYGKIPAVIISALLFSAMHCNPSQFLYTFAGGIILALLALKTKSIIFPMCIHFANNLLSVGYLLLYNFASEKVYTITVATVDTTVKIFGVIFLFKQLKKITLSSILNQRKELDFSLKKSTIRILFVMYILYALYISAEWTYII